MTFDTLCSQCLREDKHIESAMFCVQCKDLFCLPCSKRHTKVAASKHHDLVSNDKEKKTVVANHQDAVCNDKDKKLASNKHNDDMDKRSLKSVLSTASTASLKDHHLCSKHVGHKFTKFCKEDDEFCCPDCVRNEHKLCSEFISIPTELFADELKKRLKELDPTLKKIKTKLENLKKENLNSVKKLENQKAQILGTIADYRKRVDELFDKLEKAATDELDERFKQCNAHINQTVASIQDLVNEQHTIDKKAKKDIEIFIKIQKTNEHISNANQAIQRMDAAVGMESVIFNIDPSIQGVLQNILTFGAFSSTPHEYKLTHRGDFDIVDDELGPESSLSVLCLPDGKIVGSSSSSQKVLLLNTSFRTISNCVLDGLPGGMCKTSQKEIIVCLPELNTLQFMYVDRNLKKTRCFKLEIKCFSVAHHNGEIYVISAGMGSRPPQIYVYNMSAKLLRTIGTDMFKDPLFMDPYHVVVSPDGSKIYVTDGNMGLLCLTRTGVLVKKHESKILELPYGLTIDPVGNVFVCGSASNNILQLSPDGFSVREILHEQDDISSPLSVCLDYKRSLLIMTMSKQRKIKVYSMT